MSGSEKASKETRNSFVRSLRRLSSSVFRFLFRRDRREPDYTVRLDTDLPNIFRYPPEHSTDAFIVDDFQQFQELLREASEKTDTALNFFADPQEKNELDHSVWTVISEQQVSRPPRFVKPKLLSRWKLKTLFRRRGRNVATQSTKGESPWLPNSSQ